MNVRRRDTARSSGGFLWSPSAVVAQLVCGLIVLAGLGLVVLGFRSFVLTYDEVTAYLHAPVCGATAASGADCLRHETGRVAERSTHGSREGTVYQLAVARETVSIYGVYDVDEAFYDAMPPGSAVELTVFRGRVVEVAAAGHRARAPQVPLRACLELTALGFLGSSLVIHGTRPALTRLGLGKPTMGLFRITVCSAVFFAVPPLFGSVVALQLHVPPAVVLPLAVLGWAGLMVFLSWMIRHE
ncbi:hypothetical protein GCM10009639_54690 [Kitasatospora putterlickiae]|uniref:DUF3592 domain-containing protein n=1 Tax=Kitasatospora putterlickiae TaxID=221725 RepID=A0ABN1YDW7_9ACTN